MADYVICISIKFSKNEVDAVEKKYFKYELSQSFKIKYAITQEQPLNLAQANYMNDQNNGKIEVGLYQIYF